MKIIALDESEGRLKISPQSLEDLWYLSRVVENGDEVEGRTLRRFKSEGTTRATSGEKKPVTVRVKAQTVEFAESANKLRVTGPIIAGHPEEYVQLGEFHTLDIEIGEPATIFKKLSTYHKQILREAKERAKHFKTMIIVIDDEKCIAALLQTTGLKVLFEMGNTASKRDPDSFEALTKKFYSEIISGIKTHDCKYVVLAGPGFERENLLKYLKDKEPEITKKVFTEHASSAEKSALHELLKKGLLEKIIGKQKLAQEYENLEKLKAALGRNNGLALYGKKDVENAIALNAVETLLVLDEMVRKDEQAAQIMQQAESKGAEILIYDSQDDAGKEFETFKLAALLRFKVKYE